MAYWLETAKRIRAIAQAGLAFSENFYDIDRYKELQNISDEMIGESSGLPVEKIHELFSSETGYPTPKVDIRGVVIRDQRILMVREKMDGKWALPGGWADVGFSPKEVAVKEIQEEAGLTVKALRLLAVMDMKFHDHPPMPFYIYKFFIHCTDGDRDPVPGNEALDAGYFDQDHLPPLSLGRNTEKQIRTMFRMVSKNETEVLLD